MSKYKTSHPNQKLGLNDLSPEQVILLHKLISKYLKLELNEPRANNDVFFGEISPQDQLDLLSSIEFQTQLIEDEYGNTYFEKAELVQELKS